jgi:hypothetical protein
MEATQCEGRRGGRTLVEGDEEDETVTVDGVVVWWMHVMMDQGDPSEEQGRETRATVDFEKTEQQR